MKKLTGEQQRKQLYKKLKKYTKKTDEPFRPVYIETNKYENHE